MDPDTIERLIAVGLCRRHKNARRIQPSQGDGGLDVLVPAVGGSQFQVENYQVKKFADGLDDSRKRQIKKSLKRAIATHNGDEFAYSISRWYLTLPMELTREREKWLFDLANELAAPFPVEVFGLTRIEDLLLESPNIREYYLGDGMERVSQLLVQMQTLADIEDLANGSAVPQPSDVSASLSTLHARINEEDPHFAYDYEVSQEPPEVSPRKGLIASVTSRDGTGEPHVTWHISTKYDTALDDRPIPGSFTVHPERMSTEERQAWDQWRDYGIAVTLTGEVVDAFSIDLPGGFGKPLPAGEKVLKLGPAAGAFADEQASRALWVVEDAAGTRLAERMIAFRLKGRGEAGGEYRRGVDADGYLSVDLYTKVTSETVGSLKAQLHMMSDLWAGEPVQRVLPAIRFGAVWCEGNFFRPYDELGFKTTDEPIRLVGEPMIPPEVVKAVEDLARISAASKKVIPLPKNIGQLARQKGAALSIIADAASGLEPEVGVAEVELWHEDAPGAYDDLVERGRKGLLSVPWDIPFPLLGAQFTFAFELILTSSVEIQPEEPSADLPAGRKAARVITTQETRGHLRLRATRE